MNWVAICVILAIFAIYAAFSKFSAEQQPYKSTVPDDAVLFLSVQDGEFSERATYGTSSPYWSNLVSSSLDSSYSFSEVVHGIRNAAHDLKVKAVVVTLHGLTYNGAQAWELADALRQVREANKPVFVYANDYIYNNELLIASAATERYVAPNTYIRNVRPTYGSTFVKGFLDKFDIDFTGHRVALYKDYILPFVKYQVDEDVKSTYDTMYQSYNDLMAIVAKNYGKDLTNFDLDDSQIIGALEDTKGDIPLAFQRLGWINGVMTPTEFDSYIANRIAASTENYKLPNYFTVGNYISSLEKPLINPDASTDEKHIAYLALTGGVTNSGDPNVDIIYRDTLDYLRGIYFNANNVAAVVIRIDSPGGDAFTGFSLHQAINDIRAKGIPVVVSQGNVAGSAGYMLSSPSDFIFSTPLTVTGSIGVVNADFNVSRLLANFNIKADTVGLNYWQGQNVTATPFVAGSADPYVNEVREINRSSIGNSYFHFINAVLQDRKDHFATLGDVHRIAQGHIWTGNDAYQLKLVDAFGGVEDAILKARELALIKQEDRKTDPNSPGEFSEVTPSEVAELPVIFYNSNYAKVASFDDFMNSLFATVDTWTGHAISGFAQEVRSYLEVPVKSTAPQAVVDLQEQGISSTHRK